MPSETVRVVCTVEELRHAADGARRAHRVVGFVPTMGALHAGHRSLLLRSARECGHTVASIFVNPLQFDQPEDLERYPRDRELDLEMCAEAGVDTVFAPSVEEMYPIPLVTSISVGAIGERFEGASRPGHFSGVATVVAKLFSMVGDCVAYFGEKDFQQLVIVRRMVDDLSMPVRVVGCPTVRDADGLAHSSRNRRLSAPEREAATALWRALVAGREAIEAGVRSSAAVADAMAEVVAAEPLCKLDYCAAVDARDLHEPRTLRAGSDVRLLLAAQVGPVRLVDNCGTVVGSALAGPAPRRHNLADITSADAG